MTSLMTRNWDPDKETTNVHVVIQVTGKAVFILRSRLAVESLLNTSKI